jgi:hypothetical protein
MWQSIADLYLQSARRKIVALELRANELRTGAIRKAAYIAAGEDEELEQGIIDACFARKLHYAPAEHYDDNVAKIIKETAQ